MLDINILTCGEKKVSSFKILLAATLRKTLGDYNLTKMLYIFEHKNLNRWINGFGVCGENEVRE